MGGTVHGAVGDIPTMRRAQGDRSQYVSRYRYFRSRCKLSPVWRLNMSILEAEIIVLGVEWDRPRCKKNELGSITFPVWI